MKTKRNILIAFLLNLSFAVFEFFGGIFTGSVAILSDALHDLGDAAGIGVAFFLERKSEKQPDETYTYGYGRFSVLGGFLTTAILLIGSVVMIGNGVRRLLQPTAIDYNGMLIFAVVGLAVNLCAAFFTREGGSVNQRAVNLHMLEDVFGWAVVLVGAVVMRFTHIIWLDPVLSIAVSLFILIHALKNLKAVADLFLQKAPCNLEEMKDHVKAVEGVGEVHHIHLWSLDGQTHCATMHIVTSADPHKIKDTVRAELRRYGITHVTLELESPNEHCHHKTCHIEPAHHCHHGH